MAADTSAPAWVRRCRSAFAHAVGDDDQAITRFHRHLTGADLPVGEHAEAEVARQRQLVEVTSADQDRRHVAGVDQLAPAGSEVEASEDGGEEGAAGRGVPGDRVARRWISADRLNGVALTCTTWVRNARS
ncbi:hypothetical protein Ade02nite_40390 [Paractinoplanes deccanensis]|uniref:Uncharacterized protein n=1 Tax=Paractinoplanes deccanensis TaxID=113561 RepID=A0ABQ3Y5X4_9ACTN|nr:hypothetical protein Ade02nite_40390 [Actinoplanes deccanensis]